MNHQVLSSILQRCKQVAEDKEVQMSIVRAMFSGCEQGTDLWEYLEGDREKFSEQSHMILWGTPSFNEDEEENESPEALYNHGNPNQIIEFLLLEAEKAIIQKLQ